VPNHHLQRRLAKTCPCGWESSFSLAVHLGQSGPFSSSGHHSCCPKAIRQLAAAAQRTSSPTQVAVTRHQLLSGNLPAKAVAALGEALLLPWGLPVRCHHWSYQASLSPIVANQ